MKKVFLGLVLLVAFGLIFGCSQPAPSTNGSTVGTNTALDTTTDTTSGGTNTGATTTGSATTEIDSCTLLTNTEIEEIVGASISKMVKGEPATFGNGCIYFVKGYLPVSPVEMDVIGAQVLAENHLLSASASGRYDDFYHMFCEGTYAKNCQSVSGVGEKAFVYSESYANYLCALSEKYVLMTVSQNNDNTKSLETAKTLAVAVIDKLS